MGLFLTAWLLGMTGACSPGGGHVVGPAVQAPAPILAIPRVLRAAPVKTDRFRAAGRTSRVEAEDLFDEDDTDERENLARVAMFGPSMLQVVPADPVTGLRGSNAPPTFNSRRLFLVCHRFVC